MATIWWILITIAAAGGVGGVVNALMSDNGFVLPKSASSGNGKILRPGFLGNILIGAVAAVISWGLYGPFADFAVIGAGDARAVMLTLAALVGALLVGVGGARWLTNEVDKTLLRAAASRAAAGDPDNNRAAQSLVSRPARALSLAVDG